MGLKQEHNTRWNDDPWHKDALKTVKDMASSKHRTTVFEIQTRDLRPPSQQGLYLAHAYI